jgi:hypothetical protein
MTENIETFPKIEGKWFKFWVDDKTDIDLKIRPLTQKVYVVMSQSRHLHG